jgi:hypothetical protein
MQSGGCPDRRGRQQEDAMRFMMMIKTAEGTPPDPALMGAIGKLSQDMAAAGILLEAGGLAPSAKGARVRVSGAKLIVTDGPFTETKELTGGFAIVKASSRAEAIELARRFMQVHADILGPTYEAECEVREMFDPPSMKS